ncbi:MAG: Wadjet anti-phage system protein JetD domain-containing protein [Halorhodospira sp.]
MSWTTPADLCAQVQRRWDRGEILAARVTGAVLFPLTLRLKRPGSRELAEDFGGVRRWVQELASAERAQRGYGFELIWQTVNHRVHGRNELPSGAAVPTEADALRLIGRRQAAERFDALCRLSLTEFPELTDWLARRPLTALEHADDWDQLLAVLRYFRTHPRPGIYLRQLDIPGVDTKFIEQRRRLLMGLLDAVLPAEAIDERACGARRFAERYGLRQEPARVRFRILDPACAVAGLTDLAVPAEQLRDLPPAVETVFITENQTNGLAFPEHPRALVIFGLGYALERLAEIPWLHRVRLVYWGDIDTHGFAILDRLRRVLPHAESLLMDRETLEAHRALWTAEPAEYRCLEDLVRLSAAEAALYDDLRQDRLGERVRLEQERVGYGWVVSRVQPSRSDWSL